VPEAGTPRAQPLEEVAREIRRLAVSLVYGAGSGHPGGCLSAADLLAALYFEALRIRPHEPGWAERDRLVLSKGHACPALYGALQLRGYFERSVLASFRRFGGLLQGSPRLGIPGVDATCGSLGQGFSIALGMALGLRRSGGDSRVYVVLGDGELQEGEVWEAAMAAGHFGLGSLCAIVDYNKMQSDDLNARIMALEPLEAKWEAFNWRVVRVDGHCLPEILRAFQVARETLDRPTVLVAHTVKGKGVGYMEGVPAWHGSVKMTTEEFALALCDLGVPAAEHDRYLLRG